MLICFATGSQISGDSQYPWETQAVEGKVVVRLQEMESLICDKV